MKLVFATHNPHKFEEIKALLPDFIELLSLDDIGCDEEIMETANTIAGNALLKAGYVKSTYNLNCFADDTGLEVDVLDGAPGVYSARYAGPEKDDTANVQKLLKTLKGITNRQAQFKTVIAVAFSNRQKTFTGRCAGHILKRPRGTGGFGYDPIFRPQNYTQSFAELSATEKNEISHRGKAFAKLRAYLENLLDS